MFTFSESTWCEASLNGHVIKLVNGLTNELFLFKERLKNNHRHENQRAK